MRSSMGSQTLWRYSHSASIFSAVLLFTAGFLCVLLWTNDIVHTPTSAGNASTSTFTYLSPTVSTFTITYNVAIFGATWNSVLFMVLMILERDALPLSTERLRWEAEKAACTVAVVGNALYSVACLALMATLARLAADAGTVPPGLDPSVAAAVASSAGARRAGQGVTAAMAGFAAAAAAWACVMDVQHGRNSTHRRSVADSKAPLREEDGIKEA